MIDDIKKLTKGEFEELAKNGVIGPYDNDFTSIGCVISGTKPIAFVDEESGVFAQMHSYKYNLGLKITILKDAVFSLNRQCVVYKDHWVYNEFCKIYNMKRKSVPQQISHAILMGKVLGYRIEDVVRYLSENFDFPGVQKALRDWALVDEKGVFVAKYKTRERILSVN